MYYVALSAELNVNCIGVAVAPTPGGPYVDQGPLDISGGSGPGGTPLGCGDAAGHGNIDPSPFVDSDGKPYLYVSSDFACGGGSCSLKPTVSVIPLTADFLHASGARVPLFAGDPGTWEAAGVAAPTVEGPSVVLHDGTYYLFYSGGSWRAAYAMGYATASGPTGPFTKSPANPILSGTSTVLSPGGGDGLVTGPHGAMWTVYAARASSYLDPRTLRLDPFIWHSATGGGPDVPMIEGPTATPQPTQP
jgi:beta-xylosidase